MARGMWCVARGEQRQAGSSRQAGRPPLHATYTIDSHLVCSSLACRQCELTCEALLAQLGGDPAKVLAVVNGEFLLELGRHA